MQSLRIIALGVIAAICYGISHDLITTRVCLEYFTIGHPPIFHTASLILLALGWGVVATWWVGLPLGVLLAVAARAGHRPKMTERELRRPVLRLLAVMAVFALLAGLLGYGLALSGKIWLAQPLATLVPSDRQVPFLADLWAHSASYLGGFVGGPALALMTYRGRRFNGRGSFIT